MSRQAVYISGMSAVTPLGSDIPTFMDSLYQGKSAISNWTSFDTTDHPSKVGGDLNLDIDAEYEKLCQELPEELVKKSKLLMKKSYWSIKITALSFLKSVVHAGITDMKDIDNERTGVIVTGTNLTSNYINQNFLEYLKVPEYIDPLIGIYSLDTNHSSMVSEIIGAKSFAYTMGAACSSGILGIHQARNEILTGRADKVFVVAPICEYAPLYLQALSMMGAIATKNFNDQPEKASRPFDKDREGFVPCHGAGVVLIESEESLKKRKGTKFSEVVGTEITAAAQRSAASTIESQVRGYKRLFSTVDVKPEQVSHISAHATSTPQGDLVEINAIKDFFGKHAYNLKINALKSMIGHTWSASGIVELVGAVMQMKNNKLCQSINIDNLDPEIDLDVCREGNVDLEMEYVVKSSFGFGGQVSYILLKNV